MKLLPLIALTSLAAAPLAAEEARHADAHEHGVGQLNMAFDGQVIAMELHAPGADIVGFEYVATTAEDIAAIETGIETLHDALDLFVFPVAAGCNVVEAEAELEGEGEHEEHGDHHDDDHADHKNHDDHEDEKADHDDHHDHGEKHDDHDEHAEESHTEFHAEYLLNCADPSKATEISFAYFETFPNALEVEVQVITASGATAFEVERDAPTLDLSDLF